MNDCGHLTENAPGELQDDPRHDDPEFLSWVEAKQITMSDLNKMFEEMMNKKSIQSK